MSDLESIPYYRVRLDGTEAKLNAVEIECRFRAGELSTSTEVRPDDGGSWREIRFDPLLCRELTGAYRFGDRRIKRFDLVKLLAPPVLVLLWPLVLYVPGFSYLWNTWLLAVCVLGIPLLVGFHVQHARLMGLDVVNRRDSMAIPYWNCWLGWRDFRKRIAELPEPLRGRLLRLNPWVWTMLLVFLLTTWWAPLNFTGGLIVWGLLALFCVGWLLLAIPLYREMERNCRIWRDRNPPLEAADNTVPLLPWQQLLREERSRRIWATGLLIFACPFLAIAVLWLPYYGVAELRMRLLELDAGPDYPAAIAAWHQAVPEPHASVALVGGGRLPEESIPRSAFMILKSYTDYFQRRQFNGFRMEDSVLEIVFSIFKPGLYGSRGRQADWYRKYLPEYPDPRITLLELLELEADLDYIRGILREYPHLGVEWRTMDTMSSVSGTQRLLVRYVLWRAWTMELDPGFDVEAFVQDLERLGVYFSEDPFYGWQGLGVVNIGWEKILTARLKSCPGELLARAGRYMEAAEAEWRRRFTDSIWLKELWVMEAVRPLMEYLPFRGEVQLAGYRLTLEQIRLLQADYYESHAAGRALRERYRSSYRPGVVQYDSDTEHERAIAETSVQVRSLQVLIACEQYRRRHGEYPADIEALVPEFLARVPVDPFDGQPLRYRKGEVVYSVGVDGVDDGGQRKSDIGVWFPGKDRPL